MITLLSLLFGVPLAFAQVAAPVDDAPVDVRDVVRLDVMDMQRLELNETGEYIQVKLNKERPEGEERISTLFETLPANFEVHVYQAPCGKGYTIVEHTGNFFTSDTGVRHELLRETPYGCEATERASWLNIY